MDVSQQAFRDAVARYQDDNKPDPLVLQQMNAWTFECSEESVLWTGSNGVQLRLTPSSTASTDSSSYQFTLHVQLEWLDVSSKVEQKMQKRLKGDSYLQKLQQKSSLVCEANLDGTEERVACHQDVGQGLQRAIFSRAESLLDVWELLIQYFPWFDQNNQLAQKTKLALLEDVLVDACEQQQEEEELLEGLAAITNKKKKT